MVLFDIGEFLPLISVSTSETNRAGIDTKTILDKGKSSRVEVPRGASIDFIVSGSQTFREGLVKDNK